MVVLYYCAFSFPFLRFSNLDPKRYRKKIKKIYTRETHKRMAFSSQELTPFFNIWSDPGAERGGCIYYRSISGMTSPFLFLLLKIFFPPKRRMKFSSKRVTRPGCGKSKKSRALFKRANSVRTRRIVGRSRSCVITYFDNIR